MEIKKITDSIGFIFPIKYKIHLKIHSFIGKGWRGVKYLYMKVGTVRALLIIPNFKPPIFVPQLQKCNKS